MYPVEFFTQVKTKQRYGAMYTKCFPVLLVLCNKSKEKEDCQQKKHGRKQCMMVYIETFCKGFMKKKVHSMLQLDLMHAFWRALNFKRNLVYKNTPSSTLNMQSLHVWISMYQCVPQPWLVIFETSILNDWIPLSH